MRVPLTVSIALVGGLVLAGCGGAADTTATDPAASAAPSVTATATPTGSPAAETSASTASAKASASPSEKKSSATSTGKPKAATVAPRKATTKAAAPKSAAPAAGRYVGYGEYSTAPASFVGTDVVLFFHAPWCPKCQDTEKGINADGVPAGLTIVKVDFDSATTLRQKYGVTIQNTFVQIDPSGAALTKWTGTYGDTSVAGIAAKTV